MAMENSGGVQVGSENLEGLQALLSSVVNEYKTRPHTPELVNNFWRTFLEVQIRENGLKKEITIPVVSCDRTQEELEILKKEKKMWVPEAKLTYPQLCRIFPKMSCTPIVIEGATSRTGIYSKETSRQRVGTKDKYIQHAKGMDVETSIDSPNKNVTQGQLEKLFKSQGRNGMRLSTYILTSHAINLLTGYYLDDSSGLGDGEKHFIISASLLPGTICENWVFGMGPTIFDPSTEKREEFGIIAFFTQGSFKDESYLHVEPVVHPESDIAPSLGGRSEGYKTT